MSEIDLTKGLLETQVDVSCRELEERIAVLEERVATIEYRDKLLARRQWKGFAEEMRMEEAIAGAELAGAKVEDSDERD